MARQRNWEAAVLRAEATDVLGLEWGVAHSRSREAATVPGPGAASEVRLERTRDQTPKAQGRRRELVTTSGLWAVAEGRSQVFDRDPSA